MTTASEAPVVRTENLGRHFGDTRALDGVTLDIDAGQVVGVLGPNGSGKTTLLKIVAGLLAPSHGRAITLGADALALSGDQLQDIGYVSQEGELLDWLTVAETLDLVRAHHPRWDTELADTLLARFELGRDRKVGGLSTGQKQGLGIILGVAHRPRLLLLDEPAAALDPVARQDFLDLLMELVQEQPRTILISSHILTDVEKVIDQVLILTRGAVRLFAPLDQVRESFWRVQLGGLDGGLPDQLPLSGLLHLVRDSATAVAVVAQPDRAVLDEELDRLGCSATVRNVGFEEIYRQVVSDTGSRGVRS